MTVHMRDSRRNMKYLGKYCVAESSVSDIRLPCEPHSGAHTYYTIIRFLIAISL